jgi:hypothetical protein
MNSAVLSYSPIVRKKAFAGGAYVPPFFGGMYAPCRKGRRHAKLRHVCATRGLPNNHGLEVVKEPANCGLGCFAVFTLGSRELPRSFASLRACDFFENYRNVPLITTELSALKWPKIPKSHKLSG